MIFWEHADKSVCKEVRIDLHRHSNITDLLLCLFILIHLLNDFFRGHIWRIFIKFAKNSDINLLLPWVNFFNFLSRNMAALDLFTIRKSRHTTTVLGQVDEDDKDFDAGGVHIVGQKFAIRVHCEVQNAQN